MEGYRYTEEMEVRDYECDLSGIVNNANYLHYLEHARHKFLKALGVDFVDWVSQGVHMVVIRMELDFLKPLRSGDRFLVGVNTERISRLRFGLFQDIYSLPEHHPILKAKVIVTVIDESGRPNLPRPLESLLTG